MFASGHKLSVAFPQAPLGCPTDVLEHLGLFLQAQLQMSTDFRRGARSPRPFNQDPARMRVARLGDGAWATAFATGGPRGGEPQVFHALARMLKASEIAECSHQGDRHGALPPTQGLQGFDNRVQAPRLPRLCEFLRQARQALGGVVDRADVFWEDDVLGGCGAETSESPRRWAGPQLARPVERIS